MPFDGLEPPLRHLPQLDRVIDLIASPNLWIKHTYRSPWGGYCLKEALSMAGIAKVLEPAILKVANERAGRDYCCIESFNDNPQTNHGDVLATLRAVREDLISGKITPPPAPAMPAGSPRKNAGAGCNNAGWMAKLGRMFCGT